MNQAEVHKLVSALRFKVSPKPFNLKKQNQPMTRVPAHTDRYRLEICRSAVNSLIVNERLEMTKHMGITTREYAERLIQEAITHGDTHVPTMHMVDWWLQDKSAIHKLFKVLVPRLKDNPHSFTRLFNSPIQASANKEGAMPATKNYRDKVVVELVGHPFPPLRYSNTEPNKKMIHNVLLSEARREMRLQKEFDSRQIAEAKTLESEVD
jgi:large subunit ribosomal protein L17